VLKENKVFKTKIPLKIQKMTQNYQKLTQQKITSN